MTRRSAKLKTKVTKDGRLVSGSKIFRRCRVYAYITPEGVVTYKKNHVVTTEQAAFTHRHEGARYAVVARPKRRALYIIDLFNQKKQGIFFVYAETGPFQSVDHAIMVHLLSVSGPS